ncbi:MAG: peptidoglycan-binding protein [Acetobacteraceae bacterium]|jgi:hypothetical protein
MRRIIAAIVLAAAFAVPARAMQFHQVPLGDNDLAISAIGEIVDGDTDRLGELLQTLAGTTPSERIRVFVLDSPGGQIVEAEKLAGLIRRLQAGVMVLSGSQCNSACFLLFASGVPKVIAPDALIGVHSVSAEGQENLDSMAFTTLFARDAADLDVPPQIIGKMVETPPNRVAWLTRDDLALMDVKIMAPEAAPPPSPPPSPPPVAFAAPAITPVPAPAPTPSPTTRIGPSFDCAKADSPLMHLICWDADLSRADLLLVQPYYVLRHEVGVIGWKPLMVEAINFQQEAQQACGIDAAGNLPADLLTLKSCLIRAYTAQRNVWMARLSGAGLQEAKRPPDQHIALQDKLQTLGFLPPIQKPDGIYGTATRTAIMNWQLSVGLSPTGLLGDGDVARLMQTQ